MNILKAYRAAISIFLLHPKGNDHVRPNMRKGPSFHLRGFLSARKHVAQLGTPGTL